LIITKTSANILSGLLVAFVFAGLLATGISSVSADQTFNQNNQQNNNQCAQCGIHNTQTVTYTTSSHHHRG
jgi:hypothetical protein